MEVIERMTISLNQLCCQLEGQAPVCYQALEVGALGRV